MFRDDRKEPGWKGCWIVSVHVAKVECIYSAVGAMEDEERVVGYHFAIEAPEFDVAKDDWNAGRLHRGD